MSEYIKLIAKRKDHLADGELYIRKWDLICFADADARGAGTYYNSRIQLPCCKNLDDWLYVRETVEQIKEMLGVVND